MLRRLSLFFIAVMAADCLLGGYSSTDSGAVPLFLKFFLLGSLSVLLPLMCTPPDGAKGEGFSCAFPLGFVGYWAALAGVGFIPILRTSDAAPWLWGLIALAWMAGFASLLRSLRREAGTGPLSAPSWVAALALMGCFAFTASAIWGTGYSSPSSVEKIIAGSTHQDTYQLSTMAAMTRHFGLPSIGLDGLKFYHYHYFSVAVFAAVSKLSGASAVQCYALFYPAVWPPLFLFMVTAVMVRLSPRRVSVAGLALSAALLASGLIYQTWLDNMVAWEPLLSESYGCALVLLLAGLMALPLPVRDDDDSPNLRLGLCLAWLVCVSLAKIAVGGLACLVLGASFLLGRFKRPRPWIEAALVFAVFVLCQKTNVDPIQKDVSTAFSPFWFPRKFAHGGIKITPIFMSVHWLPLWIGVALKAFQTRPRSAREFAGVLAEDPYVPLVLIPALGLALVGMCLTITGGSGFYFTNQPWVAALPWTGALLLGLSEGERSRLKPALAAGALCALIFQGYPRARDVADKVILNHVRQANPPQAREEMAFLVDLRGVLSKNPACGLHIDHGWLWRARFTDQLRCWAVPNVVTAVLERPLYGSMMRPECRRSEIGYIKNHPQRDEPPDDAAVLCREARADGLACLETLRGRTLGRIDCGKG